MKNEVILNNQYSEEEKLKAVYALNMCTVSVSQIVDYNDLYILEQEYDAILNNLNLQVMPKDEALLRILTELLNTITFFRIQDIKKKQIEKQYQQRMKNAIWSAIPSLSVFISGNPIAMALSLATTVGTGYMNYRNEKVNALSEKEKTEIEMQITAIEQFNSLRRELFTTAWRLADEYGFDDHLRLTEKQISQYNSILQDQDEYRKYARLEAIQDKFEAYPPFWYFYGHTACYIAQMSEDDNTRINYLTKAKKHFEHYEKLNKFNILREDQMTASFALEYIDLLYLEENPDENKIRKLIGMAIDKAGNNNDILQLCAIACLRINQIDKASTLLKILVNESYNPIINAQLLSGIYVGERNRTEYSILTKRVSYRYLYPMPSEEESLEKTKYKFEEQQKAVLKEKFKQSLKKIIDKYSEELNRQVSIFDFNEEYDEGFFANTKKAKRNRLDVARRTFADEEKCKRYLERLAYVNLPLIYTNLFQKMYDNLFRVNCYNDLSLKEEVLGQTINRISEKKERINQLQEKIDMRSFGIREYEQLQKLGIVGFVNNAFEKLYQYVICQIDNTQMDDLMRMEGNLTKLCDVMDIEEPEILIDSDDVMEIDFLQPSLVFDVSMFGTKAIVAKKNSEYINAILAFIKNKMRDVTIDETKNEIIYRNQPEFDRYFSNTIFEEYASLKPNAIMVILDKTKSKFDLIYTTEGIVYVIRNKVRKKAPYENVQYVKGTLDLYGKKYENKNLNVGILYEIALGIDKRFINNLEQKIEYLEGMVDSKMLNDWFRNNPEAMSDGITRVYAWPEQELLNGMGYFIERALDKEHYLLQFYCELENGNILGLRIVEFEHLSTDFANKLHSLGGVFKVER